METVVEAVDTTAIELKQESIVSRITNLVVDSDESLRHCETIVVEAGFAIKRVEEELNPGIVKAHETHKLLTTQRKKYLDPLEEVKRTGKNKGATYRRRLEDERRAEEARLRAAALKEEEERRLTEAEELAEAGHEEAADEALDRPVVPPPVVLPPTAPPKPSGMYREKWTARIDNPELVPRAWCDPAQVRLNEYARAQKGQAVGTVPGVTFHNAGL